MILYTILKIFPVTIMTDVMRTFQAIKQDDKANIIEERAYLGVQMN